MEFVLTFITGPSQVVQNGPAAVADARLAVCIQLYVDHTVSKKPMNSQI